ncbi:MAG: sialate O-acetylesterase [Bacteroidia bacterium]
MKKIYLIICIVLSANSNLFANISLPFFFSNNMVLQRETAIPIWGWANINETITVKFNKQTKTTKADSFGKWSLKLNKEKAGGPYTLLIIGNNKIEINNVLVGDVWLCTGQSNMEWTVGQSDNAANEIKAANYPFIRHIKIKHAIHSLPQNKVDSTLWQLCDSTTVSAFSGIAYYFAKNIYKKTAVPIGLINASWGGTNIETWISRNAFENNLEFKEMISKMPKISLDSLSKNALNFQTKRIENLQHAPVLLDSNNDFYKGNFDDSKWPKIFQPKSWEDQSIGQLDGIVWLRKSFVISDLKNTNDAVLSLSKIDDNDITFVNGVKVGSINKWDSIRNYKIPAGLLVNGENIIAVKVIDNGGNGGIYGDTNAVKLTFDKTIIPLHGEWKFQVETIKSEINQNDFPTLAFNAMINPLIPFAIKGVLWYQGESNAGRAFQYKTIFPLLINSWRKQWNIGKFPFYFAQLASFETAGNSNKGCAWAELREAQTSTLELANTAMVVATDSIKNPSDIHPTNKQTIGNRLAALALNNLYKKKMTCNGPTYKSLKTIKNRAIISFKNCGSGLMSTKKEGDIIGFEIAGNNHLFYHAVAIIKNNKIIVFSDQINNPKAIRFGWIGNTNHCNLYNQEGFPAVPFRTDNWEEITRNAKYEIMKNE